MNILYISHLYDHSFAGPTYSVPMQIQAQAKYDNVFWYNAVKDSEDRKEWHELPYYHNLKDYSSEKISSLPEPFNNPDLIIVELFYNMSKSKFIWELSLGNFNYIIVPRGELTRQAQNRKKLKKQIANLLICKRFAQKAAAIQYLTKQEYIDSGEKWNKNHLIISNGITPPQKTKNSFSLDSVRCISIGRIEPYQKGLDILIDACSTIKDKLIDYNCSISIYGPDRENKVSDLSKKIVELGLEEIITFHDAVYDESKEAVLLQNDVFIIP